MSCGEPPGGDFQDSDPAIDVIQKGAESVAKFNNRAAVNQTIERLAQMAGIKIRVSTDNLSNKPIAIGAKEEIDKLTNLLR